MILQAKSSTITVRLTVAILLIGLVSWSYFIVSHVKKDATRRLAASKIEYEAKLKRKDWRKLRPVWSSYAEDGIVLLVESHLALAKAITPYDGLGKCRQLRVRNSGMWLVLVPYPFSAWDEWYLQLYDQDGHWDSMSPYFPGRPNCSSRQWNTLWNSQTSSEVVLSDYFESTFLKEIDSQLSFFKQHDAVCPYPHCPPHAPLEEILNL